MAKGKARPIKFRAVHERSSWRRATFESVQRAKVGRRGAANLFAEAGWRSFESEGPAHFVVIWDPSGDAAWVLKKADGQPQGFLEVQVPIHLALEYELRGGASVADLEKHFR